MANKKIPWWLPQVGPEEKKYVNQALANNFVNEGELTSRFEQEIAKIVGAKYAMATTSGTAAIFLALKALGIGYGDEVIVPDVTFIATANAAELTGAKPVLVDVDSKTLTISPEAVERAITERTKAIVPVHVTGRAADMDKILEIAERYHFQVVEDAAEALGSVHKGRCLGTWGVAGCFSFAANKTISTGQGGMVVTDDDDLYERLKPLKNQGRPVRGTGGDDVHDTIGYNFRYTDIQAALGLGQAEYFSARKERMLRNYRLYAENLVSVDQLKIYPSVEGELPQWTDAIAERRDELIAHLASLNMDCRKYWFPIHAQLAYKQPDDNFPNSVDLCRRSFWLPSAFTLSDEDILDVCSEIKKFYQSF